MTIPGQGDMLVLPYVALHSARAKHRQLRLEVAASWCMDCAGSVCYMAEVHFKKLVKQETGSVMDTKSCFLETFRIPSLSMDLYLEQVAFLLCR